MTGTSRDIHSLLIPLQGASLLLPCATAAEIIPFTPPQPLSGAPPWLLGSIPWRERIVPLIAFEAVEGSPPPAPDPGDKIVVLNALGGHPQLPFLALLAQGMPKIVKASRDNVTVDEEGSSPLALASVRVDGQSALIPDLDALEKKLLEVWLRQGPPTGSE